MHTAKCSRAKFGLELAPEKTRLIPFGAKFWRQGKTATGSFEFLGFSHHLGYSRRGSMVVVRIPARKGVHRFLQGAKEWLRRNMHLPPQEQQAYLAAKVRGYYQYFGLPLCVSPLMAVRSRILWYWQRALQRRSQRDHATWEWVTQRPWFTLPLPKVLHPQV